MTAPVTDPRKLLFEATVQALSAATWEAACARMREPLEAVCGGADTPCAEIYRARCKELFALCRVHGRLGPERAFAKLRACTEGMEAAVGKAVCVALHGFLEGRLKYGVVQHLVEGGLDELREGDVPELLDRFHWRLDNSRAHFERFAGQAARALADLREEVQEAEASQLASLVDLEATLARATGRFEKSTSRAFDKHWRNGPHGLPSASMAQALRTKMVTLARLVHL